MVAGEYNMEFICIVFKKAAYSAYSNEAEYHGNSAT
jgi:hypothetical protein